MDRFKETAEELARRFTVIANEAEITLVGAIEAALRAAAGEAAASMRLRALTAAVDIAQCAPFDTHMDDCHHLIGDKIAALPLLPEPQEPA